MNKNVNPVGKGYDRITSVYDAVACVFSFNRINNSQLAFLSHLSTQNTCLILGGGTGYFLQKVLEQNNAIHVTYVDASEKMVAYTKMRIQKNVPYALERVTFICMGVEDLDWQRYDVIVCNYFLDLFDDAYLSVLASIFKKQLNVQGLLYVTDFHIPETNRFLKWNTQMGLKILYTFFRWSTNMHTIQLPEIENMLTKQGFSIVDTRNYLNGILKCSLYRMDS